MYEYFDIEEVELDNKKVDIQICDEDENNNIFLPKKAALELAKVINKIFKK